MVEAQSLSFDFYESRPLCSHCRLRGVRRDPITGGNFKYCLVCWRARQRSQARERARGYRPPMRKCKICNEPGRYAPDACSLDHANRINRERENGAKAVVLAYHGHHCSCPGASGCWHEGRCLVTHPDALGIHHRKGNGGVVRQTRKDGRFRKSASGSSWSRYRRELSNPDHQQQLLCHNCHQLLEAATRRA